MYYFHALLFVLSRSHIALSVSHLLFPSLLLALWRNFERFPVSRECKQQRFHRTLCTDWCCLRVAVECKYIHTQCEREKQNEHFVKTLELLLRKFVVMSVSNWQMSRMCWYFVKYQMYFVHDNKWQYDTFNNICVHEVSLEMFSSEPFPVPIALDQIKPPTQQFSKTFYSFIVRVLHSYFFLFVRTAVAGGF